MKKANKKIIFAQLEAIGIAIIGLSLLTLLIKFY
jgi:hypothetical protein